MRIKNFFAIFSLFFIFLCHFIYAQQEEDSQMLLWIADLKSHSEEKILNAILELGKNKNKAKIALPYLHDAFKRVKNKKIANIIKTILDWLEEEPEAKEPSVPFDIRISFSHLISAVKEKEEKEQLAAVKTLAHLADYNAVIYKVAEFSSVVDPISKILGNSQKSGELRKEAARALGIMAKYATKEAVATMLEYTTELDVAWEKTIQGFRIPREILETMQQLNKQRFPENGSLEEKMKFLSSLEKNYHVLYTEGWRKILDYNKECEKNIQLASVSLKQSEDAYDSKRWQESGIFAGHSLELVSTIEGQDIDVLKYKAQNYLRLAMQRYSLLWQTESTFHSSFKISYSPEGNFAATVSSNQTIHIWQNKNGKLLKNFPESDKNIRKILFYKELFLVSLSGKANIQIWDIYNASVIASLEEGVYINSFLIHDDVILYSTKNNLYLYDISKKQKLSQTFFSHEEIKAIASLGEKGIACGIAHKYIKFLWNDLKPVKEISIFSKNIQAMAFSSHLQKLICGYEDGSLDVVMLEKNFIIRTFHEHRESICSIVLDSQGKKFVTVSLDKTLRLWDVDAGMLQIQKYTGKHCVPEICFVPNTQKLAIVNSHVEFWDTETGNYFPTRAHSQRINSIAISSDGKIAASCSPDLSIRFWNTENGQECNNAILGHDTNISQIAFHPTRAILASGCWDGYVHFWDISTGQKSFPSLNGSGVNVLAFSPDGKFLASGGGDGKGLYLWEWEQQSIVVPPLLKQNYIRAIAFSPDSTLMAIATSEPGSEVWLWDMSNKILQPKPIVLKSDRITGISFHSNGKILATACSDGKAELWNIPDGKPQGIALKHKAPVSSVLFNSDGLTLATISEQSIFIWDAKNGNLLEKIATIHSDELSCLAFSPDGKKLLCGSRDSTISLWNVYFKRYKDHIHKPGGGGLMTWMKFIPGSKELLYHKAYSQSIAEYQWENKTQTIFLAKNDFTYPLFIENTGKFLVSLSKDDRTIRTWVLSQKESQGNKLIDYMEGDYLFRVSPSGKILVYADKSHSILLWNLEKKIPFLNPLIGHTKQIVQIVFSVDERMLISRSKDNTIRFWDIENQKESFSLVKLEKLYSMALHPDKKFMVFSQGDFQQMVWWDIAKNKAFPLEQDEDDLYVIPVEFSHDGSILASTRGMNQIILWNSKTRIKEGSFFCDSIRSFSFSPDDQILAVSDMRGRIKLWNREYLDSEPIKIDCSAIFWGFHKDSQSLFAMNPDKRMIEFDIKSGKQIKTLFSHYTRYINCTDISPDARVIISGEKNVLCIWDKKEKKEQHLIQIDGTIDAIAFHPLLPIIAFSINTGIHIWDLEKKQEIRKIEHKKESDVANPHISQLIFDEKGEILISKGTDGIAFWKIPGYKQINHTIPEGLGCIAYSKGLLACAKGKDIFLWNIKNFDIAPQRIATDKAPILSLAFTDCSKILLSGDKHSLNLWDISTGKPISEPIPTPIDGANALAVDSSHNIFAYGSSDDLFLWEFCLDSNFIWMRKDFFEKDIDSQLKQSPKAFTEYLFGLEFQNDMIFTKYTQKLQLALCIVQKKF